MIDDQADGLEAQLAFSGLFSGDGGDSDADASAEDDALRRRIAVHNSDVQTLNGRWQQLDEQTAAELTALDSGGGQQEDIPEIYPAGGMVGAAGAMGVGIGAGFSSGGFGVGSSVWPFGPGSPLEKLLGALGSSSVEDRVEEILDEINGDQYEGDWGSWAEDNQEVAAELASNELSQDSPVPNGAEDLYELSRGNTNDPQTIDKVADTWGDLDQDAQHALLLMYPAAMGNLNGIPTKDRSRSNAIRVHGELHTAQREYESHQEEPPRTRGEIDGYFAEKERLEGLVDGLNTAATEVSDADLQILHLDAEGKGQVVGMYGNLGEHTEQVHTNVPGSERELSGLEDGLERTRNIMDTDNSNATGIYWQGMDTPDTVASNVTSSDEDMMDLVEQGASDLAGFDYAVNQEIDSENTRTTYDAHSFAGAVVGTASKSDAIGTGEKATGLQADAVVLAGPVGFGAEVAARNDLANKDMDIYWIETREDIVATFREQDGLWDVPQLRMPYTQHLEGITFEEHMLNNLDAIRLESGMGNVRGENLLEDYEVDSFVGKAEGGHGSYYEESSHSMQAFRSVAQGGEAIPFIDEETFNEFTTHRGGGAYNVSVEDLEPYGTRTLSAISKEEALVMLLQHRRDELTVEIP